MSTETLSRGALFAQLQMEAIRLGAKPSSDFSGLQAIAQAMTDAAAAEAVDAATLFVTEKEIAEACNHFADGEIQAGRLANGYRLKDAASAIALAARIANREDVKAVVKLPVADQLPGGIGAGLRDKVYRVGRHIAPSVRTSLAPLNRLVAEVAKEAFEAGQKTPAAPEAKPLELDTSISEFIRRYAAQMGADYPHRDVETRREDARYLVRSIIVGEFYGNSGPSLAVVMRLRGIGGTEALRRYLVKLPPGDLPGDDLPEWTSLLRNAASQLELSPQQ